MQKRVYPRAAVRMFRDFQPCCESSRNNQSTALSKTKIARMSADGQPTLIALYVSNSGGEFTRSRQTFSRDAEAMIKCDASRPVAEAGDFATVSSAARPRRPLT
jgi:hypothetical protein